MSIEKQIEEVLFESIAEVNEQLPPDQQIAPDKSTPLFGEKGALDSLTLVNLIVCVEQRVQKRLDIALTLADEKAMSQKNSPFRSVASLADYILLLVNESAGA